MKKVYVKPMVMNNNGTVYGLPTVLAVGAVAAAVGASSVAVGKLVGNIVTHKILSSRKISGVLT